MLITGLLLHQGFLHKSDGSGSRLEFILAAVWEGNQASFIHVIDFLVHIYIYIWKNNERNDRAALARTALTP